MEIITKIVIQRVPKKGLKGGKSRRIRRKKGVLKEIESAEGIGFRKKGKRKKEKK